LGFTASLLVISVFCGCGPSGPATYPVSGTIKVDGQLLKEGLIVFRDSNSSAAYQLTDGNYSLRATAGLKQIEITAYRETGRFDRPDPDEPPIPIKEQYIAPKFNVKTELEQEVSPEGENVFDFDVTSRT
jgi:hypothetical protein